jgi:EAL and modified HD-GYP domain-containing signal transduction protein
VGIGLDSRLVASVARQPILDRQGKVVAHELLYRHTPDAISCTERGESAGARTLSDAVFAVGLDALTCGLPAFINMTRQLLLNGAGTLLPRELGVLEIREDVPVDNDVIAACRQLHGDGYALALVDFVAGSPAETLLPWVRYVKVDVLATPPAQWRAMATRFDKMKIVPLAEKVETRELAERAKGAGFHLFQGFYFCRPMTFATTPMPARRLAYLQLLAALSRQNLSLSDIEDLVKHDVSLSYRVLRAVNSSAFAVQREITSIRSALVMLGVAQIRTWVSVWALAGLSDGDSQGAVAAALIRARCCERIGEQLQQPDSGSYFMLGLYSLLDVILRRPMSIALADMPLPASIRDALLGAQNDARIALALVVAYEQGEWAAACDAAARLGLSADVLPDIYADALRWSRQISSVSQAA